MTQSRDSILDDSRNRQKILSQTQLYSITSCYQISKALIQRSKNPPPQFFPNHAKFFSLIPKDKITLLDRPVTWSIQFWIFKIIFFAFCIFAERDIQARNQSTRADWSWWSGTERTYGPDRPKETRKSWDQLGAWIPDLEIISKNRRRRKGD